MNQEIQDLKNLLEQVRKENKTLESEIEKYKAELLSHVKYEARLLELLKDYESDTVIPNSKTRITNTMRSVDSMTDDEINQLIDQHRKSRK